MDRRRFLLSAAAASGGTASVASRPPRLRSRTFRFSYRAFIREFPGGARSAAVWLPYPQSDENQTVRRVSISAPGPVTIGREDRHGNQALFFHAERPSAPIEITLEATVTRWETAGRSERLSAAAAREHLRAEPLVPLDGPVKALAVEATRGLVTPAQRAKAIYERVTGMLRYDKSGSGWGRGDALFACDAKRGNCTDFHALIIAMARSLGIPARFAIGFPLPERRGEGAIPGYHCWAELYVAGRGWVPVDSSEAAKNPARKEYFYGHHDENRIEFTRGRYLVLEPRQQGEPLNFFIYPYAEVDGKKHDAVDREFRFRDEG